MKLSRVAAAFDGADFLFELKHDGFRCLAYIAEGRCDLVSRRTNYYERFDSLKAALANLYLDSGDARRNAGDLTSGAVEFPNPPLLLDSSERVLDDGGIDDDGRRLVTNFEDISRLIRHVYGRCYKDRASG